MTIVIMLNLHVRDDLKQQQQHKKIIVFYVLRKVIIVSILLEPFFERLAYMFGGDYFVTLEMSKGVIVMLSGISIIFKHVFKITIFNKYH